jgi:hypothetical protein
MLGVLTLPSDITALSIYSFLVILPPFISSPVQKSDQMVERRI